MTSTCLLIGSLCAVVVASVSGQSPDVTGYFGWRQNGSSRADLYCPDLCKVDDSKDRCCSCHAVPCWEIRPLPSYCNVTIGHALIEYTGIARSALIQVHPNETNATYLRLEHTSGKLTSLPENICSFLNLKYIYVQHNNIESIRNITCLDELEVLDLSYNKLTSVSNETFSGLRQLRILKLNNNAIETLDPNTLHTADGEILTVDLSQNKLYEVDITNLIIVGPYCLRNASNVTTENITNTLHFTIDKNQTYGPGYMDFRNARLVPHLINFTELDLPIQDMSKYILGRWYVEQAAGFDCDCSVARLIQSAGEAFFQSYWINGRNLTCKSPEAVKGYDIGFVIDNDRLNDMTCDSHEFCPDKCTCTDIQSLDKVVVNCTGAGLTHLPDYMPVGAWNNRQLDLIMDGNSITRLEDREYLNRVTSLSLAGNIISSLDANAVDRLPVNAIIDISQSTVRDLPAVLQRRNPNSIKFGPMPVVCDCSNTWIGVWMRNYGAFGQLYCSIDGISVAAESVTDATLNCSVSEGLALGTVLAIVFATLSCLILMSLSVYCLRYEFLILRRRIGRLWKKKIYKAPSNLDVFISFDEDDESPSVNHDSNKMNICNWTMSVLKPRLKQEGFSSFVPFSDMALATDANKYDQTIQAISDSSIYLVLYTRNYSKSSETISQFKYIWRDFKKYSFKTIIVINFDGTPTSRVNCKKMRALMRVGNPLDYSVTNKRMIDRLLERLPKPSIDVDIDDAYDEQEYDDYEQEVEVNDDTGMPEPANDEDDDDALSVVRTDVNAPFTEGNDSVHIPNVVVPNGAGKAKTPRINARKHPRKARATTTLHHGDNYCEDDYDDETNCNGDIDIHAELRKIYHREMSQNSNEHWKMYDVTKYAYSTERRNGTSKI